MMKAMGLIATGVVATIVVEVVVATVVAKKVKKAVVKGMEEFKTEMGAAMSDVNIDMSEKDVVEVKAEEVHE